MKPAHDQSPGGSRGVGCEVVGFAALRLPYDALPEVRRHPEAVFGPGLSASFFKHLDEQTVVGLAAVLRTIREFALDPADYANWGVLAAPHFLGQPLMVSVLLRFEAESAWGVSPHVVPHHSLHSLSGTISQVLKLHGPNLGVGGGKGGTGEALLAAAAWIGAREVPGVWIVLTAFDPPVCPGPEGDVPLGTACVGLALALKPIRPDSTGLRLRFLPGEDARRDDSPLDLFRLGAALEHSRSARGAGTMVVSATAPRLEVEWNRPGRSLPTPGLLLKGADLRAAAVSSGAEAER